MNGSGCTFKTATFRNSLPWWFLPKPQENVSRFLSYYCVLFVSCGTQVDSFSTIQVLELKLRESRLGRRCSFRHLTSLESVQTMWWRSGKPSTNRQSPLSVIMWAEWFSSSTHNSICVALCLIFTPGVFQFIEEKLSCSYVTNFPCRYQIF